MNRFLTTSVFILMSFPSFAQDLYNLPREFDWRSYGVVSPPKKQLDYETCWAFTAVAVIESKYAIMTNELLTFSEQQLINCEFDELGADPHNSLALEFYANRGPMQDSCADYFGPEQNCSDLDICEEEEFYLTGYYRVNPKDIEAVKNSIYKDGPAYMGIKNCLTLVNFWETAEKGDIYFSETDENIENLSHAVTLIGWNDSKRAWLAKNSWGKHGPENNGTFWISYDNYKFLTIANTKIDRPPLSEIHAHYDKPDFIMCSLIKPGKPSVSIFGYFLAITA